MAGPASLQRVREHSDRTPGPPRFSECGPPRSSEVAPNVENAMSQPSATDRSNRPGLSAGTLWTLRGLALAGFAIAAVLLGHHVAAEWLQRSAEVPFCGNVGWFDCESVLESRWSQWLGLPVSAAAVAIYLLLTLMLGAMKPTEPSWKTWPVLFIIGGCLVGAAVWFIALQLVEMHRVCTWCMAEHVIGIALGGGLLLAAGRRMANRPARITATAAIVVLLAGLIGGQVLDRPEYARVVEGRVDASGRYLEPVDTGRSAVVMNGAFALNPNAHPRVGEATARHFAVEVVDPLCGRCGKFGRLLHRAVPDVDDFAVLVVYFPLNPACNKHIEYEDEHYRLACDISRLALAVWRIDPDRHEAFYEWCVTHVQELYDGEIGLRDYRNAAVGLVGESELDRALADPSLARMLERDIELGHRLLEYRDDFRLPGFFVGDTTFAALPEESRTLAELIRGALRERAATSAPTSRDESGKPHQAE